MNWPATSRATTPQACTPSSRSPSPNLGVQDVANTVAARGVMRRQRLSPFSFHWVWIPRSTGIAGFTVDRVSPGTRVGALSEGDLMPGSHLPRIPPMGMLRVLSVKSYVQAPRNAAGRHSRSTPAPHHSFS